jgi:hypothetical protein
VPRWGSKPFVAIAAVSLAAQSIACGLGLSGEETAIGPDDGGGLDVARPDAASGALDAMADAGGVISADGSPADAKSTSDGPSAPDAADSGTGTGLDAGPDVGVADAAGSDADGGGDAASATDSGSVAPPEFAWYKLDESSGDTAHDSTANGYDIKLSQVTWGSGANFFIPGGSSPSGGATTVDAGLRQPPVSFTAWLAPNTRSDETSNSYAITPFPPDAVSGDVAGAYGFGIGVNAWTDGTPGGVLGAENVGYTFTSGGGAAFAAGVEYFVAVAIGATSASVYVDGSLVATATVTVPGAAATTTLRLGYHNEDTGYGTKRFYTGRMRDVRIFKRVLTAGEVATLESLGPSP